MSETKSLSYFLCRTCSHKVPLPDDLANPVECERCGEKNHRHRPKSAVLTLSLSITALIFFIPANLFPFMTIELYGNRNSSTIWGGVISLADEGSVFIALVVFLASLVIPLVKLVILFYLSLTANRGTHPRFKTKLYHFVEAIGRWSMLDIFLLAVLVAIMKLGPWTNVRPEPGALMFLLVVIFTMLASSYFDPQLLWKKENDDNENT